MIAALLLAAALSPLLQLAERLRCAPDESRARAVLDELRLARSGGLGLPDEQLGRSRPPSIRAGSIDVLLHELHAAVAHFPELRASAEALLADWDGCALEGGAVDLVSRETGLLRSPAAGPFPLAGQGFAEAAAAEGSLAPGERRACWAAAARPRAGGDAYPYDYAPACPEPLPFVAVAAPYFAPPPLPPPVVPPALAMQARPNEAPVPGSTYIGGGIAPGSVLFKRHLSGTVYASYILEGRAALGVNAAWSPLSYLFVRGGAGYRVGLDHSPYYSWGAGYDDWHTGTFSLQINDWGPTLPSQGLDWQHAVIDLGYKLPRLCARALCFSSYVAVDVPLKDTSFAVLRANLTFQEAWFVRLGVDILFTGGVRWIYGFGRADSHRFSVNLTYDNWGPNEIPHPGFIAHGVLTLALSFGL